MRDLPLHIEHQGPVRVNTAFAAYANDDVMLVYVDLHSKRAVLCMTGTDARGPCIYLSANEHTLHIDETADRESFTIVIFTSLPGWSVFCADGPGRYTVSLALIRDKVLQ